MENDVAVSDDIGILTCISGKFRKKAVLSFTSAENSVAGRTK